MPSVDDAPVKLHTAPDAPPLLNEGEETIHPVGGEDESEALIVMLEVKPVMTLEAHATHAAFAVGEGELRVKFALSSAAGQFTPSFRHRSMPPSVKLG